jgi:uncharacterized membrane protein (DUF4010 family)
MLVSIGLRRLGVNAQKRVDFTAAVALAVIVTWILATRALTHRYVEALSETDILDTQKMAIIALVIYPILPDMPLDPYGVLNPREAYP